MANPPEPVVLVIDQGDCTTSWAALADVILVRGDYRSSCWMLLDLFAQYPGLAVALVVDESSGIVVAVARTGTVLIERLTHHFEMSEAVVGVPIPPEFPWPRQVALEPHRPAVT